ncbi:MAG: hypothetical protein WA890_20690, partial [Micromonospora sp.]
TPAPTRPPAYLPAAQGGATGDRVTARATARVPRSAYATPAYLPAPGGPTPPAEVPGASQPPDVRPPAADGSGGAGRTWQVLIGGAAVLVLLALCGLVAASLIRNRPTTPQAAEPSRQTSVDQSAAADSVDLDSRDTDQLALTAREVFPGTSVAAVVGQPAYPVLRTQSSGSCAVAASGEVADLLVRLGCNQVVRATLRTPDGSHLLTAGLFNLTDTASAERARDRIRQLLEGRRGRLLGMAAGDDTAAAATAAARVGWQVRGHYLAYCVVTRADGQRIDATDAKAREILYEVIELYLNRGVLERRANAAAASRPTAEHRSTGQDAGPAGK